MSVSLENIPQKLKAPLAHFNRKASGFRIVEYIPGKKLILKRKPWLNLNGWGLKLVSLGFMAGSWMLFLEGLKSTGQSPFSATFPALSLILFYLTIGYNWIGTFADRIELDEKNGISIKKWKRSGMKKMEIPVKSMQKSGFHQLLSIRVEELQFFPKHPKTAPHLIFSGIMEFEEATILEWESKNEEKLKESAVALRELVHPFFESWANDQTSEGAEKI